MAAFLLAWFVISAGTAATLIAPLILSEDAVRAVTPVCESKRLYGRECFFCGTTTAFIAISRGDWGEAVRANRGAIPLYACFALNGAAAAYVACRRRARQIITSAARVR